MKEANASCLVNNHLQAKVGLETLPKPDPLPSLPLPPLPIFNLVFLQTVNLSKEY
jgi:hypothetical protein